MVARVTVGLLREENVRSPEPVEFLSVHVSNLIALTGQWTSLTSIVSFLNFLLFMIIVVKNILLFHLSVLNIIYCSPTFIFSWWLVTVSSQMIDSYTYQWIEVVRMRFFSMFDKRQFFLETSCNFEKHPIILECSDVFFWEFLVVSNIFQNYP